MNKCICDICNQNVADNQFRVKMEKKIADYEYGHAFPKWGMMDIDICENCYNKFRRIKIDKNIEDIILGLIGKAFEKYDDNYLQAAYLDAFDDIMAELTHRKIINGK